MDKDIKNIPSANPFTTSSLSLWHINDFMLDGGKPKENEAMNLKQLRLFGT